MKIYVIEKVWYAEAREYVGHETLYYSTEGKALDKWCTIIDEVNDCPYDLHMYLYSISLDTQHKDIIESINISPEFDWSAFESEDSMPKGADLEEEIKSRELIKQEALLDSYCNSVHSGEGHTCYHEIDYFPNLEEEENYYRNLDIYHYWRLEDEKNLIFREEDKYELKDLKLADEWLATNKSNIRSQREKDADVFAEMFCKTYNYYVENKEFHPAFPYLIAYFDRVFEGINYSTAWHKYKQKLGIIPSDIDELNGLLDQMLNK